MFSKCKISRAWTTNIHLQMLPHVYLGPRSHSALGNARMLNKLTKVSHTLLLFIHATRITHFWSQQHNLFLEWHACTWWYSSPRDTLGSIRQHQYTRRFPFHRSIPYFSPAIWDTVLYQKSHRQLGWDYSLPNKIGWCPWLMQLDARSKALQELLCPQVELHDVSIYLCVL